MMVVLVVSCIVAGVIIDNFRRRTLLLVFGAGSVASLAVFVVAAVFAGQVAGLKYVALAGLVGYILCYGLAIGPISYFLAAELVPLQHRSTVFCLCFGLANIGVVVTNFATLPLLEVRLRL